MFIRALVFCIFTSIFSLQSYASAPLCIDLFSKYKIVQGQEVWKKTANEFSYTDTTYDFMFAAQIYKFDNTLSLVIELVDFKKLTRSARHGTDLYTQMMDHFGVQNIRAIQGIWADGTNFTQFYANIQKGMSLEDAAHDTWSGRQAARYGFTKVQSVEFIKSEPTEFGDIPYNTRRKPIEVIFVRESTAQ